MANLGIVVGHATTSFPLTLCAIQIASSVSSSTYPTDRQRVAFQRTGSLSSLARLFQPCEPAESIQHTSTMSPRLKSKLRGSSSSSVMLPTSESRPPRIASALLHLVRHQPRPPAVTAHPHHPDSSPGY